MSATLRQRQKPTRYPSPGVTFRELRARRERSTVVLCLCVPRTVRIERPELTLEGGSPTR
jgi:hypothetical protein